MVIKIKSLTLLKKGKKKHPELSQREFPNKNAGFKYKWGYFRQKRRCINYPIIYEPLTAQFKNLLLEGSGTTYNRKGQYWDG